MSQYDIRTFYDTEQLYGDWLIDPPALAAGHALETAVLISLFTDRLADADEFLPAQDGDRRGWWGDTGNPPIGRIGSRLWLLAREKQLNEVRLRAEEYATEALQWMITDDVADTVDVTATWLRLGWLELAVDIHHEQRRLFYGRFEWAWNQLLLEAQPSPQQPTGYWDDGRSVWDGRASIWDGRG